MSSCQMSCKFAIIWAFIVDDNFKQSIVALYQYEVNKMRFDQVYHQYDDFTPHLKMATFCPISILKDLQKP